MFMLQMVKNCNFNPRLEIGDYKIKNFEAWCISASFVLQSIFLTSESDKR